MFHLQLDRVIARCIIPVNQVFRTGLVNVKLSHDGGKNYPWWNKFYVCTFFLCTSRNAIISLSCSFQFSVQPALSRQRVNIINDPLDPQNNWRSYNPTNLSLTWPSANISADPSAKVDINLYGYWEDVSGHSFVKVKKFSVGLKMITVFLLLWITSDHILVNH